MGQVGFSQIQDYSSAVAQLGLRAVMMHAPAFRRVINMDGASVLKHGLDRELEALMGRDPLQGLQHWRDQDFAPALPGTLGKIDNTLNTASHVMSKVSGLDLVNTALQRMTAKSIVQKFADLARNPTKANLKRMASLGIDTAPTARVLKTEIPNAKLPDYTPNEALTARLNEIGREIVNLGDVERTAAARAGGMPKTYPRGSRTEINNLRDSGDVPEWFNDVQSTIDSLSAKLGLKTTPKLFVGDAGKNGRAYANSLGHIVMPVTYGKTEALHVALHEFGHQTQFQLLRHAPQSVQDEVMEAFKRYGKLSKKGVTVGELVPVTLIRDAGRLDGLTREASPGLKKYMGTFEEWFAEQTSRWITTNAAPTSVVEKFFAGVGGLWKTIYSKITGNRVPVADEVKKFLTANWDDAASSKSIIHASLTKGEGLDPGATQQRPSRLRSQAGFASGNDHAVENRDRVDARPHPETSRHALLERGRRCLRRQGHSDQPPQVG
jgi:hypothetical protein